MQAASSPSNPSIEKQYKPIDHRMHYLVTQYNNKKKWVCLETHM
jgi:hypothetical protein